MVSLHVLLGGHLCTNLFGGKSLKCGRLLKPEDPQVENNIFLAGMDRVFCVHLCNLLLEDMSIAVSPYGCFQKLMVPPNHPFLYGFPFFSPSILVGFPPFLETSICLGKCQILAGCEGCFGLSVGWTVEAGERAWKNEGSKGDRKKGVQKSSFLNAIWDFICYIVWRDVRRSFL